ncbi:hypothetical protein [Curtobacterium sp. PhB115]|uniref:hypothetical protein n=1 Tax=Curtobacterium sp. PhB115 TaxID=2485173 RepID=UPI000F4C9821|nr:hypothetical protein [Curtobacterium sp. PhB115]ROP64340.1 hypothetical protein EDF19_2805 [Curtobacterium sp. PhB115]
MERARGAAGVPLGVVLLGVLATALAWTRLGPVPRSTVWAEDGGVFLRERIALGPLDTLLHPYAGYVHLVPRLVVDLGYALPVTRYAQVLSATSCLLVGLVAALVFVLSRGVVRSWPLRVVLAAAPVVLPLAPYEISGNAANLHWYALVLVPWAFAHRSRTWRGAVGLAVVVACAVLTEPLTVLFLPLLLLGWRHDLRGGAAGGAARGTAPGGGVRALPVTVAALAGAVAQLVTTLTHPRPTVPGAPAFRDVVAGYLLRPVAGSWNPDVGAAVTAVVAHGWAVVLVPAGLLLVVLVAAVVVGPWPARWMVVALVLGSGAVWWAALVANGGAGIPWAHPVAAMAGLPPQRYAAAAGMLLVSGAVVAAATLLDPDHWSRPAGRPGGTARLLGSVAACCVVAAVVTSAVFAVAPGETRRSAGPVWAAQVPAAVEACRTDPSLEVVRFRSAPWSSPVPCSWLER